MSQFIGRAEPTVGKVLQIVFIQGGSIIPQYPIKGICSKEEYDELSEEVQKHKFDFKVERHRKKDLIVEVNFKHGEKADRKWNNIFTPMIERGDMIAVAIQDFECPHLFKDKEHPIDLMDWIEILTSLKLAGVEL